jgi:predicted aspartyl protease
VTTRRALVSRLPLLIAGGAALWLVRDRLPWPAPPMRFASGRSTGWIALPPRNGLIEMPARVNGQPIRVVVDSGAQFSAIDRALAARLDLPQTVALPIVAYGVSGKPDVTFTVRLDLELPGLAIPGVRAAALDIGRLSVITGRDFQMLIGRDVLRALVLEADLPRDRAAFHAPEAYRPAADAIVVPLTLTGAGPMTPVTVEGAQLDVMVDTGSTGALALSTRSAQAAGLLAPGRRMRQAHSVSLGGLSLDRIVTARSVAVGPLSLPETPVQIYAPSAGPVPAGLLGLGFLRRFRIALDLPGRRLLLLRPTPTVVPKL